MRSSLSSLSSLCCLCGILILPKTSLLVPVLMGIMAPRMLLPRDCVLLVLFISVPFFLMVPFFVPPDLKVLLVPLREEVVEEGRVERDAVFMLCPRPFVFSGCTPREERLRAADTPALPREEEDSLSGPLGITVVLLLGSVARLVSARRRELMVIREGTRVDVIKVC